MKFVVLALLVVCLVPALATSLTESPQALFAQYMRDFGKSYTPEEMPIRFQNFVENLARIAQLRAEHEAATGTSGEGVYGLTKFADLSKEEFKKSFMGFKSQGPADLEVAAPLSMAIPEKFDWRSKGVVTPVKNQDQCGSCWAFSATETIESAYALAVGASKILELSVQQIVSCDTTDAGCNGGDTPTAYAYVIQAGGIELDKTYPYTSGNGDSGVCNFNAADRVVKVTNYTYAVPPCTDACNSQNEALLQENLVNHGPVSICVDAEPWQLYTGGILSSGCPHDYNDIDHCVQLVGYDKSGTTPYYIIRNSWGTDWGEQGYIYVEMNKNLCGLADLATLVKAEKF